MADPASSWHSMERGDGGDRIAQFEVTGLFGRDLNYTIEFPSEPTAKGEPSVFILSGQNGCGKTTILRMIDGILGLNFDIFRQLPFTRAELVLSSGAKFSIEKMPNKAFPLRVRHDDHTADLAQDRRSPNYNPKQDRERKNFREISLPKVNNVHYELLDIHRSRAPRREDSEISAHFLSAGTVLARHDALLGTGFNDSIIEIHSSLGKKVRNFIREAQVNYRKYFESEQLDLLSGILGRLNKNSGSGKDDLCEIIKRIKEKSPELKRMGVHTDEQDLDNLMNVLSLKNEYDDNASLAVLEAYVEMQVNKDLTRNLIVARLENFESIMAKFFVGKTVKIDKHEGLRIESPTGPLKETDLSSGEYHFLYMMVSALLCLRSGSIIAIDEPELSLHVSWQRKIVGALARCAAGASPLFLFATHSSAIAAEHRDRVEFLGVGE
jgi:predicted ATPase